MLPCRPGDRVATLAWNTVRHMEAWYAIAGLGAVCHTLNPRLFEADLEYIINHAQVLLCCLFSCLCCFLCGQLAAPLSWQTNPSRAGGCVPFCILA